MRRSSASAPLFRSTGARWGLPRKTLARPLRGFATRLRWELAIDELMPEPPMGGPWSDPESWRAPCDGTACPICAEGRPRDVIAELSSSWVTAPAVAPLPGYVAVVAKRHVVEPFEMHPAERSAFWEDILTAARALMDLYRPIKMNYEIPWEYDPPLACPPVSAPTGRSVCRGTDRCEANLVPARPRRTRSDSTSHPWVVGAPLSSMDAPRSMATAARLEGDEGIHWRRMESGWIPCKAHDRPETSAGSS